MKMVMVAAVLGLTGMASGQGGQPAGAPPATSDTGRVSISFKGGTVGEYVLQIRSLARTANVVISDEAARYVLPPIELTNVSVGTALSAIQFVGSDDVNWIVTSIGLANTPADPGSSDFAVMARSRASGGGASSSSDRAIEVFSIADIVGGSNAWLGRDEVLSAVEAALAVEGGEDADVRYHAESALLIVGGSVSEIRTVDRVLDNLRSDSERQTDRAMDRDRARAQAMFSVKLSELRVAESEARVVGLDTQMARLRELAAAGHASDVETAEAEGQLALARIDVERSRAELEHARAMAAAEQPGDGDALVRSVAERFAHRVEDLMRAAEEARDPEAKKSAQREAQLVSEIHGHLRAAAELMDELARLRGGDR